jgi:signal transduction histidine kinase
VRALFALLGGISLLGRGSSALTLPAALVTAYVGLAAILLLRTLAGSPRASSRQWLWVDALVLSMTFGLMQDSAPWPGIVSVVPVVAMSLLAGPLQAVAMALVIALSMLLSLYLHWGADHLPALALAVPMVVLALGPAAGFLALPNRELRQRLHLVDAFNERSDPRQGLLHHVDVLLGLLDAHFRVSSALISLEGPEPRIFERRGGIATRLLDEASASLWRERRDALPRDAGCLCTAAGSHTVVGVKLDRFDERRMRIDETARRVLLELGPETLALPLMSYGRPLGHLCLTRRDGPFGVADLHWLNEVMRELLPLLERSDLLEQLQRESAGRERERIGRDLHDSAVQPYLGLKYGLEALARQAGQDHPLAHQIQQLIQLTSQELQTLRDVVSGLRDGKDVMGETAFMGALHRQAQRFESLYGLKVDIFAPDTLHLRGSVAKAVLHMINEGLTNVRRHTSATAVTVRLDVLRDDVSVRLRNDHGPIVTTPTAFVPRSLSERAAEFGGGVSVIRAPEFTEIAITLPHLGVFG